MMSREEHRYWMGELTVEIDESLRNRIESVGFLWACQNDVNPAAVNRLIYDEYYRYHFGKMEKATKAWNQFQNQFKNSSQATHRRRLIRHLMRENGWIGAPEDAPPVEAHREIVRQIRKIISKVLSDEFSFPYVGNGFRVALDCICRMGMTETVVVIDRESSDEVNRIAFDLLTPEMAIELVDHVDQRYLNSTKGWMHREQKITNFHALPSWQATREVVEKSQSIKLTGCRIGLALNENLTDYFWLNAFGDVDRASLKVEGDLDALKRDLMVLKMAQS
jgi:hypothetical protein